jgi:hypothetical protein
MSRTRRTHGENKNVVLDGEAKVKRSLCPKARYMITLRLITLT